MASSPAGEPALGAEGSSPPQENPSTAGVIEVVCIPSLESFVISCLIFRLTAGPG